MKMHPIKLTGFYVVFVDISWALYKGFYCSLSEAQKGAEDKEQIKAQLGWLPATVLQLGRTLVFGAGCVHQFCRIFLAFGFVN